MDTEYRKHYRRLFEEHWWWRARTEFITDTLERLKFDPQLTSILDVGCGDGLFFNRLSRFGNIEGIDVVDALQSQSEWLKQIHCGPFDESFQPSKGYSLILMLDVLEHLSDPISALRNVRRLLLRDGIFLATVPAFKAAWTNHDVLNHHITRFTKQSLGELLERSGLEVLEQHYFFCWTLFAKLVVRVYEKLMPQSPKVPSLPAKWINDCLYRLSRLEQKVCGATSIPFGSSLIILAKIPGDDDRKQKKGYC